MNCDRCRSTGPDGTAHHHIVVDDGKVVSVWYISADGYRDRELERYEYFVKYKGD